jgi:hypothetical protein
MFKMGSHDPFGYLKHKLQPNEGSLKIKNHPDFLACMCCATFVEKISIRAITLL